MYHLQPLLSHNLEGKGIREHSLFPLKFSPKIGKKLLSQSKDSSFLLLFEALTCLKISVNFPTVQLCCIMTSFSHKSSTLELQISHLDAFCKGCDVLSQPTGAPYAVLLPD